MNPILSTFLGTILLGCGLAGLASLFRMPDKSFQSWESMPLAVVTALLIFGALVMAGITVVELAKGPQ